MKDNQESVAERILYFDCYSGISGDMTLGALLDLGLELEELQQLLSKLKLSGYRLEKEKVRRGGIAGTRALIHLESEQKNARGLKDILQLIDGADLPPAVSEWSAAIFERLAEAEAVVHGVSLEKVHFHEVGAVDAIIDIVGTAAALHLLKVDRVFCSPLPLGRGEVDTAHGRLPLPAPATIRLLADRKAPLKGRDLDFELVTPTGAAIVTTLADSFGPLPDFSIEAVGYGAGTIDPGYPNYLRLMLGSKSVSAVNDIFQEEIIVINVNMDDLNPEVYGYLMEKLFKAGALDVFFTPVQMKKNRPAVQLTILASPEKAGLLQDLVFFETSTFGLRLTRAQKVMRSREFKTVQTDWGPIRLKVGVFPGREKTEQFSAEFEDCRNIAELSGLPLKDIYRLAEYLYKNQG